MEYYDSTGYLVICLICLFFGILLAYKFWKMANDVAGIRKILEAKAGITEKEDDDGISKGWGGFWLALNIVAVIVLLIIIFL